MPPALSPHNEVSAIHNVSGLDLALVEPVIQ
jgi:hypothetical protein